MGKYSTLYGRGQEPTAIVPSRVVVLAWQLLQEVEETNRLLRILIANTKPQTGVSTTDDVTAPY